MLWLLTAGFAKNYRTYVLGFAAAVSAVAQFAVGDVELKETLGILVEMFLGLGLVTLRAGVPK
jgi:hypothetical protein